MEKRLFEDLLDSGQVAHRTHRARTLPVSLLIHVVAVAVIVIVPLFAVGELPESASAVDAFFAAPLAAPVAPPPPPPPAPRAAPVPKMAPKPGTVILECSLSPQGKVTDAKILRGIPLLDQAAPEAVRQWVYTPTLLNGVPVPVIMTVTVNFKLSSA